MAADIMKLVESREVRTDLPNFAPGDTVKVHVKVKEGDKERIQVFQGMVISRKGGGTRQMFTVRKVSGGIGVERMFPLYSPSIDRIEVERHGRVRRAKLYYLRDLRGKAARIEEKKQGSKARSLRSPVRGAGQDRRDVGDRAPAPRIWFSVDRRHGRSGPRLPGRSRRRRLR